MRKEVIIKRVKKSLIVAALSAAVLFSATSCGVVPEYPSQQEIVENATMLDCDTSYLAQHKGNFIRMRHNNGEPIYVCFDESYSQELKDIATESLDYIFGIVGKINNNYRYKIVDKNEFNSKIDKTKIYCTFGEIFIEYDNYTSESQAHIAMHNAWYNFATENPVYDYYELNLNKDLTNKKEIRGSFIHELLHAFGFQDVYIWGENKKTDKYYGNTFMGCGDKFDMITPNDLACLISLYADDDVNMDQMKKALDKYTEKFYINYSNWCREQSGANEDFKWDSFTYATQIIVENKDKTRNGYEYRISVDGGRYLFEIYDYYSKELIDTCEGDVINQNGVMILQNVELNRGLKPNSDIDNYLGGFIQDLALIRKDGVSSLYNLYNNEKIDGILLQYEKGLTR